MTDDVVGRVTAAVQRGQTGDPTAARRDLETLWAEVEQGGGDALNRCLIAHFLADLQDSDHDELMWDERALVAVRDVTDDRVQEVHPSLTVRGLLPSLFLSLADDHRRLGHADRAHHFLREAESTIDALADDAYGQLIRGGLEKITQALAEGSTDRLPPAGATPAQ